MRKSTTPAPTAPVTHHWDRTPASVPAARRQLHEALRHWDLTDLAGDSALVLSELLSNALEHSRSPDATVRTRFVPLADGKGVRIEVHDADGGHLPRMRSVSGDEAIRGRGLRLVDACTAHRWGTVLVMHGKAVWGEVAR